MNTGEKIVLHLSITNVSQVGLMKVFQPRPQEALLNVLVRLELVLNQEQFLLGDKNNESTYINSNNYT